MKASSIFGGVQVFNILITLIRGKAVAVLLGPTGMGINGLLQNSIRLIQNLSNLGLPQSAVRDISAASGKAEDQSRIFGVFRQWIFITAALGFAITFFGAPWLSQYTFDNDKYTWDYRLIAFTFVFGSIAGGVYTALRGTRKLKALAASNILSSIVGLCLALPLYYFYGIQGIVPAFILMAFGNFTIAIYFKYRYLDIKAAAMSFQTAILEGLPMVKLGLSMSVTTLLASGSSFLILAFISRYGNLNDVGLYTAAQTITTSYVGMVFTAMSTDYFPRLSEALSNKRDWKKVVEQQTEIVLLILTPLVFILISSAPLLVEILLSSEFLKSIDYIIAAVGGVFLKAPVWAMGFVIISSGKSRLLIVVEIIAIIVQLSLCIAGYHFYGLLGMGLGFSVSYLFSLIFQGLILKFYFNFIYSTKVLFYIFSGALLLALCVFSILYLGYPAAYWYVIPVTLIVCFFSLYRMNQVVDLVEFFYRFLKRK
jgi:O-antigen/teichoic acid export membrane protein